MVVSPDEYPLRAELVSFPQGHARVDAVLSRLIGSGGRHATLMGKPAHDNRFSFERGVEEHLDRREKSIDIDVDNTPTFHFLHLFLNYS